MAQPFDENKLEFTADAFPVAEHVAYSEGFSRGSFTVSTNGILIYQTGEFSDGSLLLVHDRDGQVIDTVGDGATYYNLTISPDQRYMLVDIMDQTSSNWDVWSYDLKRDIRTRLTFDAADDGGAVWHPSGGYFVFASERDGPEFNIYSKASNGTGDDSLFLESPHALWPTSWSSDGRYLVYSQADSGSNGEKNLWALPMFGDRDPIQLTSDSYSQEEAEISPDGRWLAFKSNESGEEEVYVASFPNMSGKWQVSVNQGDRPRWRGDGKELFYLNNEDQIMAADVNGIGASFEIGRVRPLFAISPARPGMLYRAFADGQRFVVSTNVGATEISMATMVVNWHLELPE